MFEPTKLRVAATLIGLACASAASAQQLETQTIDNPQIRRASCAEVVWQKDLLKLHPRIAEACQEVVISNDVKWARFTGEFREMYDDGTFRTTFNDRQGKELGELVLQPAPQQRAMIDGKWVEFSDLTPGQGLNFYAPESAFALATEPGVPAERMARILPQSRPAATTQATRQSQVAAIEPVKTTTTPASLAKAEPEYVAATLPDTAGPLPLLAVTGLVSLLGGIGLALRRRRARRNA